MKKIGTFDGGFTVYADSKGKMVVVFEYKDYTVSLSGFEAFEAMSEETLAFASQFMINGTHIGNCSNHGCGGCADVHAYYSRELYNKFVAELSSYEDFSFPRSKMSIYDLIDRLAEYQNIFRRIRTQKAAKQEIGYLQMEAEDVRREFAA